MAASDSNPAGDASFPLCASEPRDAPARHRATAAHQRAIEAAWRIEAPKLIASLTRLTRDIATAEDLAHDALVAAMEQWPAEGIPRNPGAWLMTAAKRRGIDGLRRRALLEQKHAQLGYELEMQQLSPPDLDAALDDDVGDDLLRLMFTACHPVLPTDARVVLTLRLLGGLTTDEIARAYLTSEPTVAQRIVRAKKTLARAGVPFEVPHGADRAARLASVLEVVYLIFNEGYSATLGDDWVRPALCEDALRLGRVLAGLTPEEPEVHGLVALMEIQASRLRARVGADGQPILLRDQSRALWDRLLIRRGLEALDKAVALGGRESPYTCQAAIAACHARAASHDETDWARIVSLYAVLGRIAPSPVVELNRAVALSMASGPAAALRIVEGLMNEPALRSYHLLPSVRGDLLMRLERYEEAGIELERAASLTHNRRERALLLERARACADRRASSAAPESRQ